MAISVTIKITIKIRVACTRVLNILVKYSAVFFDSCKVKLKYLCYQILVWACWISQASICG